jgi:hypothetical protein
MIKDEETINLMSSAVYMIVDLGKIKQLFSVVESYTSYMKITDPASRLEMPVGSGEFVPVNEAKGWYYKSSDIEEAIYYNVNQKNKFINMVVPCMNY